MHLLLITALPLSPSRLPWPTPRRQRKTPACAGVLVFTTVVGYGNYRMTGPRAAAWRPQVRTMRVPPAWPTGKGKGPVNWDADMPLSTYGPLQLRDDVAGTTH